ncbi:hypothetical protein G6F50_017754 [Rhizopus delemar]|uniref:Uncharacterized protein n=1 Tax=Rhizopus delemar TaxID=936053 RepID=A0A9P6XP50_9FUNG|nr:hypothetical protein G6F50_017754 [Rhizopus delemar]
MRGLKAGGRIARAGPQDALAVEHAVVVQRHLARGQPVVGRGAGQRVCQLRLHRPQDGQGQMQRLGAHDAAAAGQVGLFRPAGQRRGKRGRGHRAKKRRTVDMRRL